MIKNLLRLSICVVIVTLVMCAPALAANFTRIGLLQQVRSLPDGSPLGPTSLIVVDGRGVIYTAPGSNEPTTAGLNAWTASGAFGGQVARSGVATRGLDVLGTPSGLAALPAGVVTADREGDVRRWDEQGHVVRTWSREPLAGSPAETIVPFEGTLGPAVLAPDGTLLVQDGNGAWNLDLSSGAILRHWPQFSLGQMSFAPDGSMLVGGGFNGLYQHYAAAPLNAIGATRLINQIGQVLPRLMPGDLPTPLGDSQLGDGALSTPSATKDLTMWVADPHIGRVLGFALDGKVRNVCSLQSRIAAKEVGAPLQTAAAPDGTVWVATASGLLHLGPVSKPDQRCDVTAPKISAVALSTKLRRDGHGHRTATSPQVRLTLSEQATVTVGLERLRPGKRAAKVSTTPSKLVPGGPVLLVLRAPRPLAAATYRLTVRARDESGNRASKVVQVRIR